MAHLNAFVIDDSDAVDPDALGHSVTDAVRC
ncbi:hypothetical protein MGAST_25000 [Mycobacterium gastri 'Wayne']|nr:hypothetical protein MGAST_25000 [Mycobacterium gastri 'Wayne']